MFSVLCCSTSLLSSLASSTLDSCSVRTRNEQWYAFVDRNSKKSLVLHPFLYLWSVCQYLWHKIRLLQVFAQRELKLHTRAPHQPILPDIVYSLFGIVFLSPLILTDALENGMEPLRTSHHQPLFPYWYPHDSWWCHLLHCHYLWANVLHGCSPSLPLLRHDVHLSRHLSEPHQPPWCYRCLSKSDVYHKTNLVIVTVVLVLWNWSGICFPSFWTMSWTSSFLQRTSTVPPVVISSSVVTPPLWWLFIWYVLPYSLSWIL